MGGLALSESEALLEKLKANPKATSPQTRVAEAINCLVTHWQSTKRSTYMKGVNGAPDWLEYEFQIWQLGEALRPVLRQKRWRGRNAILDAASAILSNTNYGKGRQSFALLLGDFGNAEYAEYLGKGLDDQEVRGHCLKALTKAKISGFAIQVDQVLNSSDGWTRSAARKYLGIFPE